MVFNMLWTILLGVIGGIVSSLIVSRFFLIQNKHQEQLVFVARIIRKVDHISAFLQLSKATFELSYDEDVEMKREMQEKGYKTEMEYYHAHKDRDWIRKSDVIDLFKKEILNVVETIKLEIKEAHIVDDSLSSLLHDILKYGYEVSSEKELTFKYIKEFAERERTLRERYEKCVKASGKTLCRLIVQDKLLIIMFVLVITLLVGTVITGLLGV